MIESGLCFFLQYEIRFKDRAIDGVGRGLREARRFLRHEK
jgi:hypothetical protein